MYRSECEKESDINQHLPTLFEYAKKCKHITELGSRKFISTWAFLAAKPSKVIVYDISQNKNVAKVKKIAELEHINFTFHKKDDLKVKLEDTDLLFIDTWHVYDQLIQELTMHSHAVKKYIIMHDTTTFGTVDCIRKTEVIYTLENK
jgi:hypothetical protein